MACNKETTLQRFPKTLTCAGFTFNFGTRETDRGNRVGLVTFAYTALRRVRSTSSMPAGVGPTAPSSSAGDDGQRFSSDHEEEVHPGSKQSVKDAENEGHAPSSDSRSSSPSLRDHEEQIFEGMHVVISMSVKC